MSLRGNRVTLVRMIRKLLLGAIGSNAVMIAIAACVGDDPVTSTTPAGDGGGDPNTPVDSGVDSGGDASTSDAQSKVAVVDVSGGDGFGCAVRADGSVVCWGRNALGETAQPLAGGAICDGVPCRLPTQVAGITDGAKIASGPHQTCVATKAGKVLCWGANDDGVLGHPTTQDVDCGGGQFCNLTPTEVPNVSGAVGVAVGRTNACAWNATGNVTCWGHNRVGGLARGAPVDQVFAAGPSTAITTNGPTMMSVDSYGTGHYCAIRADGTVACWGRNNAGELGVASDTSPVCNYAPSGAERCEGTPRTVKNAADASIQTATSVASTDGATCVSINTDVYCWGYQGHAIAAAPQAPSSVLPTIRNGATGLSALSGSFTHVAG